MMHPAVGKWLGSVGRRLDGIVGKHPDPDDGYANVRLAVFFQDGCLYCPGTLGRSFRTHG